LSCEECFKIANINFGYDSEKEIKLFKKRGKELKKNHGSSLYPEEQRGLPRYCRPAFIFITFETPVAAYVAQQS